MYSPTVADHSELLHHQEQCAVSGFPRPDGRRRNYKDPAISLLRPSSSSSLRQIAIDQDETANLFDDCVSDAVPLLKRTLRTNWCRSHFEPTRTSPRKCQAVAIWRDRFSEPVAQIVSNPTPLRSRLALPLRDGLCRPGGDARWSGLRCRLQAKAIDEDVEHPQYRRLPAGLVVHVAHADQGPEQILRTDIGPHLARRDRAI